jgi:hypothetical protein
VPLSPTQLEQPLSSTQRATAMAATQHSTSSPPPSSTSTGVGAKGPEPPVFGPASPGSPAAFERRVGDVSEHYAAGTASERHSIAMY